MHLELQRYKCAHPITRELKRRKLNKVSKGLEFFLSKNIGYLSHSESRRVVDKDLSHFLPSTAERVQ